jgi:polysaccharide biosynthesis protein PelD
MNKIDHTSADLPGGKGTDAGSGQARLLGLRRSAWVEIVLFLTVALVLDQTVFQGVRYWDVAPHPFWILVILISAQYGTNEGLVAALAVSAALLAGNLPAQGMDQDLYAHAFEIVRRPVMWMVAAVIVGEIRNRHLQERNKLVLEIQKATESEERIALAFTTTKAAKEKLAGQVAGQIRTVLSTLRALKNVEKSKPGEVLLGTLDLVDQTIGPRKFSLFVLNNNVLEATTQRGWQAEDPFSPVFRAGSPLFQAIVGSRRFLCAADPVDEALLDGEGLLAGPLVYPETGEVVGMLKLEDLDYYDLNLVTIENFKGLCDWVGAALSHADQFERVSALNPMALVGDLYSGWYLDRHVTFLSSLARRIGFRDQGRRPHGHENESIVHIFA